MALGALATVGVQQLTNLALIVIDNERYGETGMQASHTAHSVDLARIAAAAGFASSATVYVAEELRELIPALYRAAAPSSSTSKSLRSLYPSRCRRVMERS